MGEFLDLCREEIRLGVIADEADLAWEKILLRAKAFVHAASRPHFRRTLNATGVVIHTNLGRSVLAEEAVEAARLAGRHYSNLEFDLSTGRRGIRYAHVEDLLRRLTGAEAALAVNNNAAAVLLVLDTRPGRESYRLARGAGGSRRFLSHSRSDEESGAVLREVGHQPHASAGLRGGCRRRHGHAHEGHTSNYRIIGSHQEVELSELVQLGRERNLPVLRIWAAAISLIFSV